MFVRPYLTVYPLPSRQFFALARTWLDDEAPRSGCVLTHTLLIPLEDWGCLSDVRQIGGLFQNLRQNPNYDFTKAVFSAVEPLLPNSLRSCCGTRAIHIPLAQSFRRCR